MESSVSRTAATVRALDKQLDVAQRQKVLSWAQALLDIRTGNGSARSKAIAAIKVTRRSGVMGELLERIIAMASQAGWKDRGWPARLGLAAALLAVVTAGKRNAGIAAMGGAVGVPLWMVLGAGGTLAGTLVEELSRPYHGRAREGDERLDDDSPSAPLTLASGKGEWRPRQVGGS